MTKINPARNQKLWRNPEMSEIKATENFYDYGTCSSLCMRYPGVSLFCEKPIALTFNKTWLLLYELLQSPSLGVCCAKFLFVCRQHVEPTVGGASPHNILHPPSRSKLMDQLKSRFTILYNTCHSDYHVRS